MARSSKKPVPRYTPLPAQTKPQRGHCSTCRREILTARYDALIRHFDPQPLSQIGEVEALLLGLRTWWIFGSNLYRRHAEAIRTSPRGSWGKVVRDHSCTLPQAQGASVKFISGNRDNPEPDF